MLPQYNHTLNYIAHLSLKKLCVYHGQLYLMILHEEMFKVKLNLLTAGKSKMTWI